MEKSRWKMVDGNTKGSMKYAVSRRINNETRNLILNSLLAGLAKFKIRSYSLVFYFLLALCSIVYAQPVDSLISEALQNNPQLKALESRIKAAEYGSKSTGYLPPPALGIEFSQIPTNEINIWDKALSQSLSFSQMFPLGGKLSAMENAQRKNIDIAGTDYQSFKLQLISRIKKLYYEIWLMEHHTELRDENISLLEALYKSTELQYQVNKAMYSDLLLIQAEIASNRTEVEILENRAISMIYEMNALIGRDINDEELVVQHNWKIDTTAYDVAELEKKIIEENPSLTGMESMIEMNELEVTANQKELIPDLMLGGMIMRMPGGMILTSKSPVHMLDGNGETEIMYGLMASITLPFAPWSSGKYSAKEEELSANISGLRSAKENMKREMTAELKSLLNRLDNARTEIRLYSEEVIPLYKKTVEVRVFEFQNNRLPINSLIETLTMLLMKEEALSEAEAEHQKVLAEIESLVNGKW